MMIGRNAPGKKLFAKGFTKTIGRSVSVLQLVIQRESISGDHQPLDPTQRTGAARVAFPTGQGYDL